MSHLYFYPKLTAWQACHKNGSAGEILAVSLEHTADFPLGTKAQISHEEAAAPPDSR